MDEDKWCVDRYNEVKDYLAKEKVEHGDISEWPAWDVVPYTSIWPIESLRSPGYVGWWVICGDHPTDYVSAEEIKEPRYAYKAIAERWLKLCEYAIEGKSHPTIKIELRSKEQVEMLRSRAETFLGWVANDEHWHYE